MPAMSETTEVRLHGAWGSAHATMARNRNALALKGVQYDYVEVFWSSMLVIGLWRSSVMSFACACPVATVFVRSVSKSD